MISLNFADPAEVVSVPAETVVDSGQSVSLECIARANPMDVDNLITWTRAGYDFAGRTTIENPEPGKSILTFNSADRSDVGIFECRASNGIGSESLGKAKLVVRCKLMCSYRDVRSAKTAAMLR
jgi:Immunoglobulin domain